MRIYSSDRMAADHLRNSTDTPVRRKVSVRFLGRLWLFCDAYICNGNIRQQVNMKFLTVYVVSFNYEIKRVRGTLGSLQYLSCNIGILIAFVLGHFLSYGMSPIVLLCLPILFLISFSIFPETPQFLLSRGLDSVSQIEKQPILFLYEQNLH